MDRLSRAFDIIWNQVGAVRVRWLIDTFENRKDELSGTYWGLHSDYRNYKLDGAKGYSTGVRRLLERVRTDLDPFTMGEIACLKNHGYALADTAVRKWCPELIRVPADFQWPSDQFADEQAAIEALADSGSRGILEDLAASFRSRFWFGGEDA